MVDLCLPLNAGEDTFKLHSVQLELAGRGETDPRAAWEEGPAEQTESNAGNIPGWRSQVRVSMQHAANTPTPSTLCVFLHRSRTPCTWYAIFPDVLHSAARKPRTLGAAAEDCDPGSGRWLLPLRSSRSPPVTASLLSARRYVKLWSSETQSSGTSVLR